MASCFLCRVEQLVGSHTLVGAFITQFQPRSFGLAGLGIIVIWALSPIGSQAALRIAAVTPSTVDTVERLTFINSQQRYHRGEWANRANYDAQLVSSIFSTSLLSVTALQGQTLDVWGNLRVPMVESLAGYEDHEWKDLPSNRSDIIFASLIGVPFGPKHFIRGHSCFTLDTSYMNLDCPVTTLEKDGDCKFTNFTNPVNTPPLNQDNDVWYHAQTTNPELKYEMCNGFQVAISSCQRDCVCEGGCSNLQNIVKPWPSRRFIWESSSRAGTAHIECNLRTTYVQVNYTCKSPSDCQATSARLTKPQLEAFDTSPRRNMTGFDMSLRGADQDFLSHLTRLYPLHLSRAMPPILGYILSPTTALTEIADPYQKNVTDIDHTKFQIRLAQLLNTLYMTGISPHTMLGIVPAERARYDTSEELIRNTELNTTMVSATVTVKHDVLRCDKGWFVALLVASLILLAATVMGAIFKGLSLGPDIFGSLSLATLDNQCNDIASGGSALDGIERARLLKRVSIKLGDVEPSSTVGRIALVAELNDRPVGKLERRRAYE
ncbi:hypothetical protein PG989_001415 [Apiospora arundinis]